MFLPAGDYKQVHRLAIPTGGPDYKNAFAFSSVPLAAPPAEALRENGTALDKLCYTLRNMTSMEEAPDCFDTELIRLLLKSSETTTFTPQERAKYLHDMTTKRDIENYISYARKEGLAAGVQKGREEGVQQEKLDSARKMKELGLELVVICQVTGLTPEQVAVL